MDQLNIEELKKRIIDIKKILPNSEIVPSVLTNDPIQFELQFKTYSSLFSLIEVDILDNTLVKNQTLNLVDSLKISAKYVNKIGNVPKVSLHFMTNSFDLEVIKLNFPIIEELIISFELIKSHTPFFDSLVAFVLSNNKPFKFGIYFDPTVNMFDYKEEINFFDFIQLMTVEPGEQGRMFKPEVLDGIPNLKLRNCKLKVDGGLDPESIQSLSKERLAFLNTVNSVSIGSYFTDCFKTTTPK